MSSSVNISQKDNIEKTEEKPSKKSSAKTTKTTKTTSNKTKTTKTSKISKAEPTEKIGYIVPKPFTNKQKVLFCASEAAPFVKIGGLGDVAGALPKALCEKNIDARVVIPFYSQISEKMRAKAIFKCSFRFPLGWRNAYCGIFQAEIDGVIYYLIDNEQYFKRGATYGQYDDGERFAFFSKAVLEIIPYIDFYPDIIHANDWHTAMVPVYLDTLFRNNPGYQNIKTVFSIHNIEFQGKYDPFILGDVFGLDERNINLLHDGECINLMKGAIECSNIVTTVSKSYADEILSPYFGWGLEGILNQRKFKLKGIVNGIDTKLYSPKTDKFIKTKYTLKTINKKQEDKKDLQQLLGFDTENGATVIGMVTRLTPQKGIDLFYKGLDEILKNNVQLIILGTGYRHFEDYLRSMEYHHHDKVRAYIDFSSEIASKIYAGSDLFLMPSKAEPCGLSQLIAMSYGTIPIIHEVGGLKDTVIPYNSQEKTGCGVTFKSYDPYDMADAVKRGCEIINSEQDRKQIIANAMNCDFSWNKSADEYISIYKELTK